MHDPQLVGAGGNVEVLVGDGCLLPLAQPALRRQLRLESAGLEVVGRHDVLTVRIVTGRIQWQEPRHAGPARHGRFTN